LVCVCVVLCSGRDLATSSLLVQGVLPSVKMIMKLKNQRSGPKGAVESVKIKSKNYFLFRGSECVQIRQHYETRFYNMSVPSHLYYLPYSQMLKTCKSVNTSSLTFSPLQYVIGFSRTVFDTVSVPQSPIS
jgi:hypothetical protein